MKFLLSLIGKIDIKSALGKLQNVKSFICKVKPQIEKIEKINPKYSFKIKEFILSFFYGKNDPQPVYFYIFIIFWVWISFCLLKFRYYYINSDQDVSETFILQLLAALMGLFTAFNIFKGKDK